jgi:hypothetical protein
MGYGVVSCSIYGRWAVKKGGSTTLIESSILANVDWGFRALQSEKVSFASSFPHVAVITERLTTPLLSVGAGIGRILVIFVALFMMK